MPMEPLEMMPPGPGIVITHARVTRLTWTLAKLLCLAANVGYHRRTHATPTAEGATPWPNSVRLLPFSACEPVMCVMDA